MAPKRPTPLEYPPSASSSENEELASDEEMEEEEEAADEPAPALPLVASVQKPASQREKSDLGESDDSPSPTKLKASKPLDDAKVEKARSKPEAVVVQKPAVEHKSSDSDEFDESPINPSTLKAVDAAKMKKESKKRELEAKAVEEGKKRKKSESELTESKMKNSVEEPKMQVQKVFSGESEKELLKVMADFYAKNGKDFMSDQDGFYEYVKEEFDGDFNKSQLMTKVRNLKKKYKRNDEKVKNGEELKPGDHRLYELCKKIWAAGEKSVNNGGSDVAVKLNGQLKRSKKEHIVKLETKGNVPNSEIDEAESGDVTLSRLVEIVKSQMDFGYGLNCELVVRGLGLIGKDKRVEMVNQWDNLLRYEAELRLRRLELVNEQGRLALDAFRASWH